MVQRRSNALRKQAGDETGTAMQVTRRRLTWMLIPVLAASLAACGDAGGDTGAAGGGEPLDVQVSGDNRSRGSSDELRLDQILAQAEKDERTREEGLARSAPLRRRGGCGERSAASRASQSSSARTSSLRENQVARRAEARSAVCSTVSASPSRSSRGWPGLGRSRQGSRRKMASRTA